MYRCKLRTDDWSCEPCAAAATLKFRTKKRSYVMAQCVNCGLAKWLLNNEKPTITMQIFAERNIYYNCALKAIVSN